MNNEEDIFQQILKLINEKNPSVLKTCDKSPDGVYFYKDGIYKDGNIIISQTSLKTFEIYFLQSHPDVSDDIICKFLLNEGAIIPDDFELSNSNKINKKVLMFYLSRTSNFDSWIECKHPAKEWYVNDMATKFLEKKKREEMHQDEIKAILDHLQHYNESARRYGFADESVYNESSFRKFAEKLDEPTHHINSDAITAYFRVK